jgi:hypothetical protein
LGLSVTACSFNPHGLLSPDSLLPFRDDIPISAATSAERNLVYESPGLLAVFHGTTCAKSDRSGEEVTLRVQEELDLPKELDQATVLLNGYHLRYLEDDHHVQGLGTAIGAIEIDRGVLRWEAGGAISDHNFDDGYEWCYTYTVLAWNSLQLQATVDQGDTGHAFRDMAWTHGSSLLPVPGYLSNPAWAGLDEVAILPRGFGVLWGDDHHVLQFAYKHDSGEVYVEGEKTYGNFTVADPVSQVGTGFVTWETTGLMKDNDLEHGQAVLDLVTGLGGSDVGLISPPFTVAPREDAGLGCSSLGSELHLEEREVQAVPYQFAIPVLSGWDLAYVCDDEHVTEIGAWIPKWEWQPGTSAAGGTLRYSVATQLRDKDNFPTFHTRTQVKILGLRRITATTRK